MSKLSPFYVQDGGSYALRELDSDTLHRLADYFESQALQIRALASSARHLEKRSILNSRDRLKRRGDLLALADLIRAGELSMADAPELGFSKAEARAALLLRSRS